VSNHINPWRHWRYSIGAHIIAPFLLLTVLVASIGTFVITSQFTQSVNQRYTSQLIDAGRVVAERMVSFENDRLRTLRAIAATQGVAQNLSQTNTAVLHDLILPIISNDRADVVEVLDLNGREVYGWLRLPETDDSDTPPRSGRDFADIEDVQLVLSGYSDEFGDKRAFVSETTQGAALFTIGPVFLDGRLVGAVMVGDYLRPMTVELSQNAVARVTLYDGDGRVVETTLGTNDETSRQTLQPDPEEQAAILTALQEDPERVQVVATFADSEVPLRELWLMDQNYRLAFGDWRLRGQSFGLFSVAFPTNVVNSPLALGRNLFLAIFLVTFFAVLLMGVWIARRITKPLSQLVLTTTAVGEGHLDQRTGITRPDEIGQLAASFDQMTARLESRNQQLRKQTSELETILNNITDGVILLDTANNILTANAAARQLLADLSHDFFTAGPIREITLPDAGPNPSQTEAKTTSLPYLKQYQIGSRSLITRATEVLTPGGEQFGVVLVLRDVTQEATAEHLKDAFITNISNELHTPLTAVKIYTDLLLKTGSDQLDERQLSFLHSIQKSSAQLEAHINQLIHLSEIQMGAIQLDKQSVPFADLVQTAADNWRSRFEGKRIALQLQLQLPEDKLCVSADPVHMGWAIESLLNNAYKYTNGGGQVDLRVTHTPQEVQLDVVDTGIGIAQSDQPYLFHRFFRTQNQINSQIRGVGLGLFITQTVVEMHRGSVRVQSELGHGSTFSLALPLETP